MKTTQAQFAEYEIKGSMFLAMGEFDREVTDFIMHLMDTQTDELPVKEDHVQVVACVVCIDEPLYFSLAYMNTGTSMFIFLSIDEISADAYLDLMNENKVFTQNPKL
ncbi:hypothetical protein N8927_05530 [Crocinitomicaceae bacterium]|nr:hypothetical protein [Crocinitomicaceae bacterium]